MNTIVLLVVVGASVVLAADEGFLGGLPTSINGNIGLTGAGYGDVYGGKIKEGVYGAGGRVGGNLGLVGTAGLGRKKRQAASANAGASASGPNSFSMANAAAGSGSFNFGSLPGAVTAAPSVPAATAAPTAKPCPKRRRRSMN